MSDVRIPEWRLREITADPDKAVVTVGEVRLMAAELLQFRKLERREPYLFMKMREKHTEKEFVQ